LINDIRIVRRCSGFRRAFGAEAALGASEKFDERIEQTASLMPSVEAAAFRQTVEAEREQLIQQYQFDPVCLKNRLGVMSSETCAGTLQHVERRWQSRLRSGDCPVRD
jgi:hypothetical protein